MRSLRVLVLKDARRRREETSLRRGQYTCLTSRSVHGINAFTQDNKITFRTVGRKHAGPPSLQLEARKGTQ